MPQEVLVGKSSELGEGERKIIAHGESEIGVYRLKGRLYAYANVCAHQGGAVCEGLLMPKVEEVLGEDRTYQGMRFNYDEWHIVCPWHGWEYDVTSGEMVGDRKFRLRKYQVIEKSDQVYVLA